MVMIHFFLGSQDRVYHAVRHRVQPVYLGIKLLKGRILAGIDIDAFRFQPLIDIVEIQHGIDIA